jgi:hypothetical protein
MKNLILLIALFCVSFQTYAAYPAAASVQNGIITNAVKATIGNVGATISTQVANDAFITRAVTVSAASANAAMIRRMVSPMGLLLTAAAIAAGYYLDQQAQKLMGNPSPDYPIGAGRCFYPSGNYSTVNTLSDCTGLVNISSGYVLSGQYKKVSNGTSACMYQMGINYSNGNFYTWQNLWFPTPCDSVPLNTIVTGPSELSESQKTAFRENQDILSPAQNLETDNGLADRQVPEIANSFDDAFDDYQKATDTNPDGSPNTATQPDTNPSLGDDGLDSMTGEQPKEETTAETSTLQTDCDKYPAAVGCLGLGDIPTADEIQTIDVPVTLSASSWGSGSCPAPIVMSLSFGSKQFSLQPLCDFMSALYPVVIAVSWLMAGFIVVGAVKD